MRSLATETKDSGKRGRTFGARLGSTLVLWGVVIAVFLSGQAYLVGAAIGLLGMLGLWEYSRLWREEVDVWCLNVMMVVGLVYTAVSIFALGQQGQLSSHSEWAAVLLVVMGCFIVRFRRPVEGKEAILSVAVATLGLVLMGLMFGGGLMRLVAAGETTQEGLWLLMLVLASTKFTDMGAYLVGVLIGKNKMIPHVSPGKTWEGFVGALFFCQLGVWGAWWLAGDSLDWLPQGGMLALMGLIIALGAVAGDLAESILKRSVAAKDSGEALPGIGGVLDLIDSICFTGPMVWMFLKLVS